MRKLVRSAPRAASAGRPAARFLPWAFFAGLACLAACAFLAAAPRAVAAPPGVPGEIPKPKPAAAIRLPADIGEWHLTGAAQHFDERTIFDYMDGGGEIYLAYLFGGLDVFEYHAEGEEPLIVEIYRMRTADDAFGLLSLDWTGAPPEAFSNVDSLPRSVWNNGSLRVWADEIFARVLPYKSSPSSEQAARELGRLIGSGRKHPQPPSLARSIMSDSLALIPGSLRYFRTHIILNAAFYLSPENVLELDRTDEAVVCGLSDGGAVLLVRYSAPEIAARGVGRFRTEVLGEPAGPGAAARSSGVGEIRAGDAVVAVSGTGRFQEGWCGYRVEGGDAAFVFTPADSSGLAARLAGAFGAVAGRE